MAQAAQPERGAVSFVFEPRGMRGALGSDLNRTIYDLHNCEHNPALICLKERSRAQTEESLHRLRQVFRFQNTLMRTREWDSTIPNSQMHKLRQLSNLAWQRGDLRAMQHQFPQRG